MLRDFVNKRSMLLNETMRRLSHQCATLCGQYALPQGKATDEQGEPRPLAKFTMQEEVCLAKCEAKMVSISAVVERHIDESFNPDFLKKFV